MKPGLLPPIIEHITMINITIENRIIPQLRLTLPNVCIASSNDKLATNASTNKNLYNGESWFCFYQSSWMDFVSFEMTFQEYCYSKSGPESRYSNNVRNPVPCHSSEMFPVRVIAIHVSYIVLVLTTGLSFWPGLSKCPFLRDERLTCNAKYSANISFDNIVLYICIQQSFMVGYRKVSQ